MRIPSKAGPSTARLSRTVRGKYALLVVSAVIAGTLAISSEAQKANTLASPGCTLHKDVYTCDLEAFRRRLSEAHIIGIETQRNDRFTAAQLRDLITGMGKTAAIGGQPADLTFVLSPVETPGIQYGPAEQPLATLRVYAPGPSSSRGPLLWAETWTGHQDRPWPSVAHALVEQFKERVLPR